VILICPSVSTATVTKVSTIAARTKSLTVFVCAAASAAEAKDIDISGIIMIIRPARRPNAFYFGAVLYF